MKPSLYNVALLIFLLLPPLLSQTQSNPNKDDDYKLVVNVNLVGVLVTVTTAEGALVSGLKSEEFQIYENWQLQKIVFFAKEADQPLRFCLLFDSSASIASELKTQQGAAIEFLQSIFRPRIDRASIIQFSDEVEQLQKFGNRLESLNRAIRSIKPGGGTSLYDAIFLAAGTLSRQPGRKVIVVVSDGEDTTSQVLLDECLRTAQNSEAVLYALVVQPFKGEVGRNLAGEHAMIFLANRTGRKSHEKGTLFCRPDC